MLNKMQKKRHWRFTTKMMPSWRRACLLCVTVLFSFWQQLSDEWNKFEKNLSPFLSPLLYTVTHCRLVVAKSVPSAGWIIATTKNEQRKSYEFLSPLPSLPLLRFHALKHSSPGHHFIIMRIKREREQHRVADVARRVDSLDFKMLKQS